MIGQSQTRLVTLQLFLQKLDRFEKARGAVHYPTLAKRGTLNLEVAIASVGRVETDRHVGRDVEIHWSQCLFANTLRKLNQSVYEGGNYKEQIRN